MSPVVLRLDQRPLEQGRGIPPARRERASQAVFARYLNVTTGLTSQWERGEKRPPGSSLKLLNLVNRRSLAAIA